MDRSIRFSAVVTVYDRPDYYAEAVRSALPLGAGRSDFEVILLKNTPDPSVDSVLQAEGAQVRFHSSPVVGSTLRRAFELCRGEYLLFLDDDDLFRPAKLRRFEQILSQFPDLGYYHHAYDTVLLDPAGVGAWERHTLRRRAEASTSPVVRAFSGPGDARLPAYLAQINREQNLSSTIVHRDVAEQLLGQIELMPSMTDTIMLTGALLTNRPLVFDSSVQTVVRRHRQNSSNQSQNLDSRLQVLESLRTLLAQAQAPTGVRDYLDLRAAREVLYVRLLGQSIARPRILRAMRAVARHYDQFRAPRDLLFLSLGATECASPWMIGPLRTLAAGVPSRTAAG